MEATFIHKFLLAVLAGLAAAAIIQFYRTFIIRADAAMNQGYEVRYGISGTR